jgi:hypothetical protein
MATNTTPGAHVVTDGKVGTRVFVGTTTPSYPTTGDIWIDNAAGSTPSLVRWSKTAAGGETSLSGLDDSSVTLSYTVGMEQVYLNGVLLVRGTDYAATTGTSITGLTALVASDIVTVIGMTSTVASGNVTLATVAAKGDLLVGTGASTLTNLTVGSSSSSAGALPQVLVSDSTQATGLKWSDETYILSIMQAI